MTEKDLFDWLTLACGASGLMLGIVNATYSYLRKRVRVKVVPKTATTLQGGILSQSSGDLSKLGNVVIEITNLSDFPIFIKEIGFNSVRSTSRSVIISPFTTNKGQGNPIRLDSRESTTVFAREEETLSTLKSYRVKSVYVETGCGIKSSGTNRIFRQACTLLYEKSQKYS